MKITDVLKSEHELIKSFLAVLDSTCKKIDKQKPVDPDDLTLIIEFFRNYADAFHHAKEEDILFRRMEEVKVPDEKDLIGSLTADHTLNRLLVGSMEYDVQAMLDGAAAWETDFAESARGYIILLLHHICKEDNTLCPLVEENMTAEQLTELEHEFLEVEQQPQFPPDIGMKYTELLNRLKERYGISEEILKLC